MSRSLAKRKKAAQLRSAQKFEHKHLHLVKAEQQVNHSHSPISASDIERLEALDPQYPKKLFELMGQSIEVEKQEISSFYAAIEREQLNDKLAIEADDKNKSNAMMLAAFVMVFLIVSGAAFVYFGHELIGGAIVTTVLLGFINAIFNKNTQKE